LERDPKAVVFGEDIEDPKGGVFGLIRGLSSRFPGRVRNSPLSESTIAGTAAGLAIAGFRPIFELQFIDFVGPAVQPDRQSDRHPSLEDEWRMEMSAHIACTHWGLPSGRRSMA
jgi:hypothetical protein